MARTLTHQQPCPSVTVPANGSITQGVSMLITVLVGVLGPGVTTPAVGSWGVIIIAMTVLVFLGAICLIVVASKCGVSGEIKLRLTGLSIRWGGPKDKKDLTTGK
jgi:hypothetical protein